MKKSKSFLMGILGVMLVFGMIATGCPVDPDPGPTTYTVTFDTDGGSAVPDQTVEEGKKVMKPVNPTKGGHTFDSWYKDAGKTTPWNFDVDTVTADTTIYAKWLPGENLPSYTVTFDANGGTPAPQPQTVVQGGKVSRPTTNPVKDGYTFVNWYKDAAGTTTWNFDVDVVMQNTTIYAKWLQGQVPTYTVTFNTDGGSAVASQPVVQGEKVPKPADPTKSGSAFVGWNKDGTAWNFDTDTVTENITLTAQWTTPLTVSFNADGGTPAPQDQFVAPGGKVTKPADPAKDGYTFAGWYKDEAKTTPWNFVADTVTANTIIYAKWLQGQVSTYTVTFNTDGGSTVAKQTVVQDGKVTKPADPSKQDYTFAAWYKDAAGTTPWNFDVDTVTADTTIYAKWLEGESVLSFTVSFDTDGGSAVADQTVVQGERVTKPADPAKTGHSFVAWYKDEDKTTLWNFDVNVVTKDTTIYAKWLQGENIRFYTVSFNTDGGSTVANQTVAQDERVTEPDNPYKNNYTFTGWYKDADKTELWNFDTDTVTADTTLHANFIPGNQYQYSIGTTASHGSISAPATAYSGQTVELLITAEAGYTLKPDSLKYMPQYGDPAVPIEAIPGNDLQHFTASFTTPANTWLYEITISAEFGALISSITLSPATAELPVGGTLTLVPAILPAAAYNKALAWSSSDTSVATVDDSGVVSAVSAGTATISAAVQDGGGAAAATAQITVKAGAGVAIAFTGFSDETIDLSHEGEQTLSKSNGDNLTVSLFGVGDDDSIMWYEDGTERWSSTEYNIYAYYFSLGPHTVSAVVVKDGVPYSKTLKFQVTK